MLTLYEIVSNYIIANNIYFAHWKLPYEINKYIHIKKIKKECGNTAHTLIDKENDEIKMLNYCHDFPLATGGINLTLRKKEKYYLYLYCSNYHTMI